MTRAGYTFLVSSMVGLVTAEPYIKEVVDRKTPLYLVCPEQVAKQALEVVPSLIDQINPPLSLSVMDPIFRLLHTSVTVLLAKPQFKLHFSAFRDPRRAGGGVASRLLLAISLVTARFPARTVNRLLSRLLRLLQHNPFPTRRVIAVSYPSLPHRLCARDQEVVTLMESWDHPVKKAAGYYSDTVIGWNDALTSDWLNHQGASRALVGYPVKLRYAIEHNADPVNDNQPEQSKVVMYAAGTSSNTDRPGWFQDELEVIDELCRATADSEWSLLIKPKPNGQVGDYDAFVDSYEHVEVGKYRQATSATDYYLDDDYNRTRISELERCCVVVNVWTTFALDAACAGKPVLQLDLRSHPRWPALSIGMSNYHLSNYLLESSPFVIRPSHSRSLAEEMRSALSSRLDEAKSFSAHIRSWLSPSEKASQRVRRILDALERPSGI